MINYTNETEKKERWVMIMWEEKQKRHLSMYSAVRVERERERERTDSETRERESQSFFFFFL